MKKHLKFSTTTDFDVFEKCTSSYLHQIALEILSLPVISRPWAKGALVFCRLPCRLFFILRFFFKKKKGGGREGEDVWGSLPKLRLHVAAGGMEYLISYHVYLISNNKDKYCIEASISDFWLEKYCNDLCNLKPEQIPEQAHVEKLVFFSRGK